MLDHTLLRGSRIHLARLFPVSTLNRPSVVEARVKSNLRYAPTWSATLPLQRQYHSSPKLTSLAGDLISLFTENGGATAEEAATWKATQQRARLFQELERVPWIDDGLREILQEGHPDRVFHALLQPEWGPDLIRTASPTLFACILQLIPPSHFLDPYTANYFLFSPSQRGTLPPKLRGIRVPAPDITMKGKFRMYSNLSKRFDQFAAFVDHLLDYRSEAGFEPDLDTFEYLLSLSNSLGDPVLADTVFGDLCQRYTPTQRCYDLFMGSKVWAGANDFYQHDKRYVTKRLLALRRKGRRGPTLMSYRTGPKGLKVEMTTILQKMLDHGYEGTEETFAHLITALGREGDMTGVKNILRSVWNIDAGFLEVSDEEDLETTPLHHEQLSPLRPTSRLLFTIAHVYRVNLNPLMGLRLVDFISRQYDLQIPNNVWIELLVGVMALNAYRSSTSDRDLRPARLSGGAFEDLWAVMTDQPHNVIPDEIMYYLRAKTFESSRRPENSLDTMQIAIQLFDETKTNAHALATEFFTLSTTIAQTPEAQSKPYILPASFFDLRNEVVRLQVRMESIKHNFDKLTRKLLKLLAAPQYLALLPKSPEWQHKILPNAILALTEFLPPHLEIKMQDGDACLVDFYRHRPVQQHSQAGPITTLFGIFRLAFDQLDHENIMSNLQTLNQYPALLTPICSSCGDTDHFAATCHRPWSKSTALRARDAAILQKMDYFDLANSIVRV